MGTICVSRQNGKNCTLHPPARGEGEGGKPIQNDKLHAPARAFYAVRLFRQ